MNVHCDKIAKKALNNHLWNVRSDTHDPLMDVKFCRMLLLETARLYVNRSKQTSDIEKGLWRDIGCQKAQDFYKEEGLLPPKVFDAVEWDRIKLAMKEKSQMYKLWCGKQCTGHCGTNSSKLVQWKMSTDLRCPDYNRLNGDAAHLMVCPKMIKERNCRRSKFVSSRLGWHHTPQTQSWRNWWQNTSEEEEAENL